MMALLAMKAVQEESAASCCFTCILRESYCLCLQKELVLEDIDDDADPDTHSTPAATGNRSSSNSSSPFPSRLFGSSSVSSSGIASGSSSSLAGLQQLLPEQQRQLSTVLWGDAAARPDAAWQQGLVFADTPGLEWGLVQLAGESSQRMRSERKILISQPCIHAGLLIAATVDSITEPRYRQWT
jgi:hypothetical protein